MNTTVRNLQKCVVVVKDLIKLNDLFKLSETLESHGRPFQKL